MALAMMVVQAFFNNGGSGSSNNGGNGISKYSGACISNDHGLVGSSGHGINKDCVANISTILTMA